MPLGGSMSKGISIRTCVYTVILSATMAVPVSLSGQVAHSKPAPKPTKPADPLHDEAESVAFDLLNSTMRQCGDSYYWMKFEGDSNASNSVFHMFGGGRQQQDTLYQYKNVSFMLQANKVTQADALNGLQWDGFAYLQFNVYRQSAPMTDIDQSTLHAVTWGNWTDASFDLDTKGGLWKTDEHGNFIVHVTVYTDDDDGSTHTSRSNEPFQDGRVLHLTKLNGQWMADGKIITEAKGAMVGGYWGPANCRDIPGTTSFGQLPVFDTFQGKSIDSVLDLPTVKVALGNRNGNSKEQAQYWTKRMQDEGGPYAADALVVELTYIVDALKPNELSEESIVLYKQDDPRKASFGIGNNVTAAFDIYLTVSRDEPRYDPAPAGKAWNDPNKGWNVPADSWNKQAQNSYKANAPTGTLETGTVCRVLMGWRKTYFDNKIMSEMSLLSPYLILRGIKDSPSPILINNPTPIMCYSDGQAPNQWVYRSVNLASGGWTYLRHAEDWVNMHMNNSSQGEVSPDTSSVNVTHTSSAQNSSAGIRQSDGVASRADVVSQEDSVHRFAQYVGVESIPRCAQKIGQSGSAYAIKIVTRQNATYYEKLEGGPGSEHLTKQHMLPAGLQLTAYLSTNKVGSYWYQAYDQYIGFGADGSVINYLTPFTPDNKKAVYFDEVAAGTEDMLTTASRVSPKELPKHWPISGYVPVDSITFCADRQSNNEASNSNITATGTNLGILSDALTGKTVYPTIQIASTGLSSHRLITANGAEQIPPVVTLISQGGSVEYIAPTSASGSKFDSYVPFTRGMELHISEVSAKSEYVEVEVAYLQDGKASSFDPGHVRIVLGGGWQSAMTTDQVLARIRQYLPESSTPGTEEPAPSAPAQVTWSDDRFGSKWMTTDNGQDVTFEEAKQYCSSLPNTERFKTWHLPRTIVGVSWIVDYSVKPIHVRREFHLGSGVVWVTYGWQNEIPQIFDFTKGSIVQEHPAPDAKARALCINEVGK
jgi:hypothetical protein